jgi:hypothetical protein
VFYRHHGQIDAGGRGGTVTRSEIGGTQQDCSRVVHARSGGPDLLEMPDHVLVVVFRVMRQRPKTVVCDTRDFGIGPAGSPRHKRKLGLTVNFTPTKRTSVYLVAEARGEVALLARRLRRRRAWPLVGPEADVPHRSPNVRGRARREKKGLSP